MTRILLIDDMRIIHNRIGSSFGRDIILDNAYSYEEAKRKIKSNSYDLIITDCHLGDQYPQGGLEIAKLSKEKGIACNF